VLYAAAIPFAFVREWIADAICVMVARMCLVPDRRIESRFHDSAWSRNDVCGEPQPEQFKLSQRRHRHEQLSRRAMRPEQPGYLQRVRLGAEREARSGIVTAAVVRVGGALIGGALLLAGAGTDPHPVDASQMRELADRYNQKLKQQLGVQVLPLVSPDEAGLAVGLRF
jgi:hypothetical protein